MQESPPGPTEPGTPHQDGGPDAELTASLARVERLARSVLRVARASVTLTGEAPGNDPDAPAAFQAEAPLLTRDGTRLGTLHLRHPTPRPPLSPQDQAALDDLAALAVAALERRRAAALHQRLADNTALRERLLHIVAAAPSFAVAIDSAMAALREATECMLCLFFRLGPDGQQMHLVAGQASSLALTTAYLEHLRQTSVRIDNSLVGAAASTGRQQVVSGIDSTALNRYPAIGLSVSQNIVSQIVTPISLGAERYSFSVGFGAGDHDIDNLAPMLMDLASSLLPLLRRLRDTEEIELFRRVVETSNDSVIISEVGATGPADPRICYVNAAFTQQTGYRLDEIAGKPAAILQGDAPADHPAPAHAQPPAPLATALVAGRPIRQDVRNRRRDGSRFWVDSNLAPLHDVTGALTHWVAIERDITERKAALESIALNEQRFRLIARATADAVWDSDLAAGTTWWNEGMQSRFGYPAFAAPTPTAWWFDRIDPEARARVAEGLRAAIASDTPQWSDEYRFRRADGSYALIVDRGFFIRNAAGVAIRMVGCMVDVTRERQLEEQLRQAQRMDAIGKLTGGVAHDFNNLLAIIIGNAELLQDIAGEDEALLEPIGMIVTAAERGADLTSRLLAFARLHPLDPKATDLNRLLPRIGDMVDRLIGDDIAVELIRHDPQAPVVVDVPQLENAVLNLCINARDAMPEGGRLRIETGSVHRTASEPHHPSLPPGDYVTLAVTDTGTGMTSAVVERAFEPFFTTKAFGKGSGLGLSMVFGFISQSNGHIDLRSEVGQGTCVTLYFPRAAAATIAPEPAAEAPPVPGGQGKVLLVEDDAALQRIAAAQLVRLGYRVLCASDGMEGLDLVRSQDDIDLLFTDIVMPGGMNGYQLAEQAKAIRPALPVLFTSGYPDREQPNPGRHSGIRLLQKPYRLTDLATAIRNLLTGPDDRPD